MTTRREMFAHGPARENLLDWLRDAHAMEVQAEAMLTGQASRVENRPEAKARVAKYITQTKLQPREVERCLESLGEDTAGEAEVAHACERIPQREKAITAWLAERTPATVQRCLERECAGRQSKR